MLYADVLNYLSHTLPEGQDVAACEEARAILLDAGARNLADLRAASIYADTTDSQARHLLQMGKVADTERLETEVYAYAEKVLAKRPGDLRSMANRALAADLLGRLAIRRHDYAVATEYAAKSAEAGESYVRFNPSDLNSWVYWIRGARTAGDRAAGAGPGRRGDRRLPQGGGARARFAQARQPGAHALEQLGPVDDQRRPRRPVRRGPEIASMAAAAAAKEAAARRRRRAVRDVPCSNCTATRCRRDSTWTWATTRPPSTRRRRWRRGMRALEFVQDETGRQPP